MKRGFAKKLVITDPEAWLIAVLSAALKVAYRQPNFYRADINRILDYLKGRFGTSGS